MNSGVDPFVLRFFSRLYKRDGNGEDGEVVLRLA